jgi:3-oxoacyl-[acyl-carrier protein] reductase
MDDKDIKLVVRDIAEEIPVKRFGDPEDVGELAAFLASPRSSFITATIMYIDGGMKGPPISVV